MYCSVHKMLWITETCSFRQRCKICNSLSLSQAEHITSPSTRPHCAAQIKICQCPPQCLNCLGPYKVTNTSCPVLPKRDPKTGNVFGTYKNSIRDLRKAGRQQWSTVNECPSSATATARRETSGSLEAESSTSHERSE